MNTEIEDRRYCTFIVGGLYLGVPVTRVQEVIRSHERTRVPLVSPIVNGLINLRGEIVTTIDLRRRLEMSPLPDNTTAMNVVVRTTDGPISILVDEIRDVLGVGNAGTETIPATLTGPCRDLTTDIYKLDDELLLILDIDLLLDIPVSC